MPDPIKSEIITPPPNEPQPDRESQLDNDLSKLFEVPNEPKSEVKEPAKESVKEPAKDPVKAEEPREDLSNRDKIPETEKPKETKAEDSKPTSKEGWKVLKESHAKAKKEILEKDQELAKLKASLAEKGQFTSQEAEKLKKEIEDLKSYRAMVDIQADPEFMAKFDEPIAKRADQISKMLTEWGVADAIIQKIDYTDPALLDRISDSIAENKDKISSKKFLRLAEEINELYDKKTEQLEEYRKNYKNILESKKKESFTKQAENEGRTQKHIQFIADMKNEKGEVQFPFLKEIQVNDPTNPAEVEQVDRHNKAVAILRQKLDLALKAETPEDRAEVAVAAVSAHWTSAQLRAALKQNESLRAEIAKLSKVTSDTPKSQRIRTETNGSKSDNDLDLDSALSNFMATTR